MPQTDIQNTSRTECSNDECVRVTRSCIDGDCTERRVVIPAGDTSGDVTTSQTDSNSGETTSSNSNSNSSSSSSSSSNSSSNSNSSGGNTAPKQACKHGHKTFTILMNDIDITIVSSILSLLMFIMFIFGLVKMKKK